MMNSFMLAAQSQIVLTILGFTVYSFNSTTISERHRSLLTGSKEENGLFLEIQKYEDSTEKEYSVAICRGHLV